MKKVEFYQKHEYDPKRDISKTIIRAKDNGLPKVVTGIRRCGKSTLLKDLYTSWLKENGVPEDHILFLSLD